MTIGRMFAEMIRLYVAYMRVVIVSFSYFLYEYLPKLKKIVNGLVLRSLASINITDCCWTCYKSAMRRFVRNLLRVCCISIASSLYFYGQHYVSP